MSKEESPVVIERKRLNNLEEAYRVIDAIPEFAVKYQEVEAIDEDSKGPIPWAYQWFYLEREQLDELTRSAEYKEWGLGDKITSDFRIDGSDKSKKYGVAFFINPKARGMMKKWYEEGGLEKKLKLLRTKGIEGHIVRLLTHENALACSDFAVEVMKQLNDEEGKSQMEQIYFNQITDGDEQFQFWTFGPYIFEALKSLRFTNGEESDDRADFLKVLLWLRSRKRVPMKDANSEFAGIGIELRWLGRKLYLSKDGFHSVHKFVEKVGEHIAKYLNRIEVDESVVFAKEPIRKLEKEK